MMCSRFAYLIIAHKSDLVFETLLKMIDDERNDIFIHMDKKNIGFSEEQVKRIVKKSHVYFTGRKKITWGGYSLINAELSLVEMAVDTGEYKYYHLLSGQDLPIKSQEQIMDFFDGSERKEFVGFQKYESKFDERVNYYHPLQEIVGREANSFWGFVQKAFVVFQRFLHVNRNKKSGIKFAKGSNWFSITDELAKYIVTNKNWIRKIFKYTRTTDEMFLQTLICNSVYFSNVNHVNGDDNVASLRFIDWERGDPYVFRSGDFNELLDSPLMFARKFDADVDAEIINMLYYELCSENCI